MPALRSCSPTSAREVATGDVLITHPLSCLFASIFDQAALLLHESNQHGVAGLMLNKPTGVTLGQLLEKWQKAEDKGWLDGLELGPLLEARLFKGGPIIGDLQDSLQWLHTHGRVDGAQEV